MTVRPGVSAPELADAPFISVLLTRPHTAATLTVMTAPDSHDVGQPPRGSVGQVFVVFLRLGLTSFGGPVAHLGYFREAFVQRRAWLTDRAYAEVVALCQFLPGPTSSQVGMVIGLQRGGVGGLLAAWVGFTMPSAILLVALAYGLTIGGDIADAGWVHGVKAAAVAVVAHAVWSMARSLTPDAPRLVFAILAMAVVLLAPSVATPVAVIVIAGVAGLLWRGAPITGAAAATGEPASVLEPFQLRVPRRVAVTCATVFCVLLVGLPIAAAATGWGALRLAEVFYRAGALVFGGGHVVLPLLQADLVPTGVVDQTAFLAGYGAAQAVPGPLFTFAAYLGALATGAPSGLVGAAIALIAIFLPGALLVVAVLPLWNRIRHLPGARRVLMGVNAAVVGILAAALWTPVVTEGITSVTAALIAVLGLIVLVWKKVPAWAVVLAAALVGAVLL